MATAWKWSSSPGTRFSSGVTPCSTRWMDSPTSPGTGTLGTGTPGTGTPGCRSRGRQAVERGVDFARRQPRATSGHPRGSRFYSETRWTRRSEDERTTRTSSSDVCVRLVITTIPTSPRFAPRPRLRRENQRSPTVAARRFRASSKRLVRMSLVARAVSETRRARYARGTRRCACGCASWADARTRTRTGTLPGGSPRVGEVPRGAPSSRRGIPSPSGRVGAAVNGAAGHLGRLRGRPGRVGARDRLDLERVREHAHRRPTRRGRERRIIQRGG